MTVNKLRLIMTCRGCPEQYDVYLGEDKVGYLRLRHGFFRAEWHGEVVYSSGTRGDGSFEERERSYFLNRACEAILKRLAGQEEEEEEALYTIDRSQLDPPDDPEPEDR